MQIIVTYKELAANINKYADNTKWQSRSVKNSQMQNINW